MISSWRGSGKSGKKCEKGGEGVRRGEKEARPHRDIIQLHTRSHQGTRLACYTAGSPRADRQTPRRLERDLQHTWWKA